MAVQSLFMRELLALAFVYIGDLHVCCTLHTVCVLWLYVHVCVLASAEI